MNISKGIVCANFQHRRSNIKLKHQENDAYLCISCLFVAGGLSSVGFKGLVTLALTWP